MQISEEDKEMARQAAHETFALTKEGKELVKTAAVTATDKMTPMIEQFNSPGAKAEALKHHGFYIGIGQMFVDTIIPMYHKIYKDLLNGKPEREPDAYVHANMWLAKVFMEIQKGLTDEQDEA